jgi:hypothetical protein
MTDTIIPREERRGAVLLLDEQVLHHLLHLPKGVRVLGMSYDHVRRAVVVGVESEQLGPVPINCELPVLWSAQLLIDENGHHTVRWPDLEPQQEAPAVDYSKDAEW